MRCNQVERSRLARYAPCAARGVALLVPVLAVVLLSGCVPRRDETVPAAQPLHARMSEEDVRLADAAVQHALEEALSGDTREWRNADTGGEGSVMPERTWRSTGGLYCRAYRETLTFGTRAERYRGVACRDRDGVWRPES